MHIATPLDSNYSIDGYTGLNFAWLQVDDYITSSDRAFSSNFGKGPWPKLGKNDRLNSEIGKN